MKIIREQFTRFDRELHPECNNAEYLEYEEINTGISKEICTFGYKSIISITDRYKRYKWITKKEALENIK